MECSRASVGQLSLDEFVKVVATIYSAHDKHRSIWDVWCHTIHHAAGIAEQIRKGATAETLYTEIADFSLWLFTALLKLNGNFGHSEGESEGPQDCFIRIQSSCSDLLWHKYPKRCAFCYTDARAGDRSTVMTPPSLIPCNCKTPLELETKEARQRRIITMRHYSASISEEKPTSMDEWQEMFGTIFATSLRSLSLADIALHLMEELGEASDAMARMYSYSKDNFRPGEPNWRQWNLEAQIADVFSWLFALAEELDHSGQNPEGASSSNETVLGSVKLSGIIWARYGSEKLRSFCCRICGSAVCRCSITLVPATTPKEDLVQLFKESVLPGLNDKSPGKEKL